MAADVDVRMLDIDPVTFDRAYNAVANSMLWFISHLLYATPSSPAAPSSRSRRRRADPCPEPVGEAP